MISEYIGIPYIKRFTIIKHTEYRFLTCFSGQAVHGLHTFTLGVLSKSIFRGKKRKNEIGCVKTSLHSVITFRTATRFFALT